LRRFTHDGRLAAVVEPETGTVPVWSAAEEKNMKPNVTPFFDEATFTYSYVVREPEGDHCVIIDSVLDFDVKSGRTSTASADEIIAFVREQGLTVDWILETHPHADHLTAAPYLKEHLGGRTAIGVGVKQVQSNFKAIFNLDDRFATDGRQFDHLLEDGEAFRFGNAEGQAMFTPGHTPSCMSYVIGDAVFVGDTMFMPDFGSARCDFPDGDARTLYRSVKRILALPPETRLFMCHDYAPGGREYKWETTVAEQRANNIHLNDAVDEDSFVKMRSERDAKLEMPVLILPAIQINIRAGNFPEPEDNGISYLKLPMNAL
jgi:glyoxylase-like metal-dependent hydrolase (beta-lactamase superfamily II)